MKKKLSLFLAFVLVLSLFVPVTTAFADADSFVAAYAAATENPTLSTVGAAMKEYDALDESDQGTYSTESGILYEDLLSKALAAWDGVDDFSDANKTYALWNNNLYEKITDGAVKLPKSTYYSLNENILPNGERLKSLHYDFAHVSTGSNKYFDLYLLGSNTGPYIRLIDHALWYGSWGWLYGPYINGTDWTLKSTDIEEVKWNKNSHINGKVSVDYNWDNWNEDTKDVTVTFKLLNNEGSTVTYKLTYTYNGTETTPVFNIGFNSETNNYYKIDNVTVISEELAVKKADLYNEFTTNHKDALAFDYIAGNTNYNLNLCRAMVGEYNALDSYTKTFFSETQVTTITNAANYVAARDYVANHQSDIFAADTSEVAVETIIAAYNEYLAFDDAVKAYITEDEKATIEAVKAKAIEDCAENFKTTHAPILAKTVDVSVETDVTVADEKDLDLALSDYKALHIEVKAKLTAQYSHLKALQHQIVNVLYLGGWDYTDDFSNEEKSINLWTNMAYGNITDGEFILPKSNIYALKDGMLAEGEKPVSLHFDVAHVTSNTTTRFNLYLLGGNTGPYIQIDSHWLEYKGSSSTYGMTGSDWTLKQKVQSSVNWTKGNHVNAKITVDYDWSAWAESKDVTITFNLLNSDGSTITYELIYTYNGTEQSPDFNIGFQAQDRKDGYKIDNVAMTTTANTSASFEIDHHEAWELDITAVTTDNQAAVEAAITAYGNLDEEAKADYELEKSYLDLLQKVIDGATLVANDVNGDGEANIRDLVRMKKYSANEIGQYDSTDLTTIRQGLITKVVAEETA